MFSLDYVSITFKDWEALLVDENVGLSPVGLFLKYYPEFESEFRVAQFIEHVNHFTCGYKLTEHMFFKYDDHYTTKKGYLLEIPSHGISHLYELLGIASSKDPATELFKIVNSRHSRFARLDINIDDYDYKTHGITAEYYCEKYWQHKICTHSRVCNCFRDSFGACTAYFGSRTNGKYLRIYDKYIQSKGKVDAVRYEVEFHSQYCDKFVDTYLNNKCECFGDILLGFFKVIEKSKKEVSNVSRIDIDQDWNNWLQLKFNEEIKPLKFPKYEKGEFLTSTIYNWMYRQNRSGITYLIKLMGKQKFFDTFYNTGCLNSLQKKALADIKLEREILETNMDPETGEILL